MPGPRRVSPPQALESLRLSFGNLPVCALPPAGLWGLLQSAATAGVAGGAIYDRIIATVALRNGAGSILTLNPRHFAGIDGLRVVVPPV